MEWGDWALCRPCDRRGRLSRFVEGCRGVLQRVVRCGDVACVVCARVCAMAVIPVMPKLRGSTVPDSYEFCKTMTSE